jgi:hypothetical protein
MDVKASFARSAAKKAAVKSPSELAALLGVDVGGGGDDPVEAVVERMRTGPVAVSAVPAGRVASALEEVRWAKENIGGLASRGEAPSEFAWLLRCRLVESKEFFEKFVFTFFPKLLPRDAGEGDEGEDVDGGVTLGMIERIVAERDKAISAG